MSAPAAPLLDAPVTPLATTRVLAIAGAWLVVAIVVGASGLIARLRPPAPQVVLITITGVLILLGVKLPRFRAWLMSIDLRAVVALHLTRLVAGATFIVLSARGELTPRFALPAGWGDILVAVLAMPVLAISPRKPSARRIYLAWNVLGFADILMVVANAAVQGTRDPSSMRPLFHLPLSLLITFLVPLIIASHVLLFVRLLRGSPAEGAAVREPIPGA